MATAYLGFLTPVPPLTLVDPRRRPAHRDEATGEREVRVPAGEYLTAKKVAVRLRTAVAKDEQLHTLPRRGRAASDRARAGGAVRLRMPTAHQALRARYLNKPFITSSTRIFNFRRHWPRIRPLLYDPEIRCVLDAELADWAENYRRCCAYAPGGCPLDRRVGDGGDRRWPRKDSVGWYQVTGACHWLAPWS